MKPLHSAMICLALLSGAAQADFESDQIQNAGDVSIAAVAGGSPWARRMAMRFDVTSDALMEWNAIVLSIATESGQSPAQSLGAIAAVHMAMFEALNFREPRYASRFVVKSSGFPALSRDAVTAGAAHQVLVQLYPEREAALDAALRTTLDAMGEAAHTSAGAMMGKSIGAIVWALRGWEVDGIRNGRGLSAIRMNFPPDGTGCSGSVIDAHAWHRLIAKLVVTKGVGTIESARIHALSSLAAYQAFVTASQTRGASESHSGSRYESCAVLAAVEAVLAAEFDPARPARFAMSGNTMRDGLVHTATAAAVSGGRSPERVNVGERRNPETEGRKLGTRIGSALFVNQYERIAR